MWKSFVRASSDRSAFRRCEGKEIVSKRPRYSRWRRLPPVYRLGEDKGPDPNLEPQRLTVYLPGTILDAAEAQAHKAGIETIQEYCTDLLRRAIEAERVREQVAEVEARRGPLEGLYQIANDPEYLAEWSALAGARESTVPKPSLVEPEPAAEPAPGPDPEPESITVVVPEPEVAIPDAVAAGAATAEVPMPARAPAEPSTQPVLTPSAQVVLRHCGQAGDDPQAFLPSLRRGESAPLAEIAELARALQSLEAEYQGAATIHRQVAYALHRLALEAQVLHTDAWPGAFDAWTVDTIRAVQEAVDRVLSGQDIRYYPADFRPEDPL